MQTKLLTLAAGLLLVSAGAASASPGRTTTDLNLRSGPGTSYSVIDTMPAGAPVDIRGCSGSWCRVAYGGTVGYAAANLLAGTSRTVVRTYTAPAVETAPAYAYFGPDYWGPDYAYDYGPGLGFAYEPGFSIGFGFGGGWHHGWRGGGWHHGGGWHGGGGWH